MLAVLREKRSFWALLAILPVCAVAVGAGLYVLTAAPSQSVTAAIVSEPEAAAKPAAPLVGVKVPSLATPRETAVAAIDSISPQASKPASLAVASYAEDESVDSITTGSLAPVTKTMAVDAPTPKPSEPFTAALALIASKDYVAAFNAAAALENVGERRAIEWAAIYYGGGDIGLKQVEAFSTNDADFATGDVFRTRLEQALIRTKPDATEIIRVLSGGMPVTLEARILLALAYVEVGEKERGAEIARAIWTEDFLDKSSEDRIHKRLGSLLDADAHWARAVHLMMHDRATGAERLLPFLTDAQKSLVAARNAASRGTKKAKDLLDKVDESLKTHPVYLFTLAQRARAAEDWDDAIKYLDQANGDFPDAAEFWYERRTLTRQLLALGDAERAYKAAAGYTIGPDGRLVESHFHAGFIALSFLKQPEVAIGHFEAMRVQSTLPDSVTQANYWLGRAKLATGDKLGADEAFATGAEYPTVYYGQLARAALGITEGQVRDMPDHVAHVATFEGRAVVHAIRLFVAAGNTEMAVPLLRGLSERLETAGELALAAQLADDIDMHTLAMDIADTADKRGMPIDAFNFPDQALPTEKLADIDVAAVLAIARQESRFQVSAKSSAGALGLMQLMPATAKEVAKKVGVPYEKSRLTTDADYNAQLGSTYLADRLNDYDGSLVLAAAAYNAGAGNANKWIKAYGDPRADNVDPVIWVELIPFQETRKYVQRVLGNYLVYRVRLGGEPADITDVMRKIPA